MSKLKNIHLLIAAIWLFQLILFYPGFSTFDSMWMYTENAEDLLSGWHPRGFQILIDFLSFGRRSSTQLIIFNFLIWLTALIKLNQKFRLGGFALLFLASPALIVYLAGLYNVTTAALLMLLFWLISLEEDQKKNKINKLFVWLPLLAAFCVRDEAVYCAYFLILSAIASRSAVRRVQIKNFLSAGALFLIFSIVITASDLLFDKAVSKAQLTAIYDLSSLSIKTNKLLFPEELIRPGANIEKLKNIFDGSGYLPVSYHIYKFPSSSDELKSTWLREVGHNFKEYILGRTELFSFVTGLKQGGTCSSFDYNHLANYWGPDSRQSSLRKTVFNLFDRYANSLVFKPWVYIAGSFLCVLLLPWVFVPNRTAVICLVLSSWLHCLFLFFTLSTCDYRYFFWPILSSHAVMIIVFAQTAAQLKVFYFKRYAKHRYAVGKRL